MLYIQHIHESDIYINIYSVDDTDHKIWNIAIYTVYDNDIYGDLTRQD